MTASTLVTLRGAAHPFDRPAGAGGVLVGGAGLANLFVAGKQVPAGDKSLHPANTLEVEAEVSDQMVDVLDALHSADEK